MTTYLKKENGQQRPESGYRNDMKVASPLTPGLKSDISMKGKNPPPPPQDSRVEIGMTLNKPHKTRWWIPA
ncbi:hypothetical protein CHS0354_008562 [Potamilus streckersoni]|uniref:Uncharacterized protein n=1 Tax=Potamilus streckersoni TaxID=2493646 RepID=A0AAE0RSB4_9BIVA|nr:hypothetical protein CHS0354_008562 [Potamilus streckersoni]